MELLPTNLSQLVRDLFLASQLRLFRSILSPLVRELGAIRFAPGHSILARPVRENPAMYASRKIGASAKDSDLRNLYCSETLTAIIHQLFDDRLTPPQR